MKRKAPTDIDSLVVNMAKSGQKRKKVESEEESDFDQNESGSDSSGSGEEDPETSEEKHVTKKGKGAAAPKTKAPAVPKEPKGPSKKQLKEEDKAAQKAEQAQWDKIPLFKSHSAGELKTFFDQIETLLQKAITAKSLDVDAFSKVIQELHGTESFNKQLLEKVSKFLVDKAASAKVCVAVMAALLEHHSPKPVYHKSMFFPSH